MPVGAAALRRFRAMEERSFDCWIVLLTYAGFTQGVGASKPYAATIARGKARPTTRQPQAGKQPDGGEHIITPWDISLYWDAHLRDVVKAVKIGAIGRGTWRNRWYGHINYGTGDVVFFGGLLYEAIAPNIDVEPGTDPSKWSVFTLFRGDHDMTADYLAGDVIESTNYFYQANVDNSGVRPGANSTWSRLSHWEPSGEASAASNATRGLITAKLIS